MQKYLKWGAVAVAIPMLLVIMLTLLLYFPPFQRWAVGKVTQYASEEMDMDITVGDVRLAFPLDLRLNEVKVLRANDSIKAQTDTVAHIASVVADVQLWPLLKGQVMIDELTIDGAQVNTCHFISSARIKGRVGRLTLAAHGIDLGQELVDVDKALLREAVLDIQLIDTVPPDTTESESAWIVRMERLNIEDSRLTLHMAGDTMSVDAVMGDVLARQAYLDLGQGAYKVNHLEWEKGGLNYDMNFEPRLEGLDFSHLALSQLAMVADSFVYSDAGLDVKIRSGQFMEKSGLMVDSLSGTFQMDSVQLALPNLSVQTRAGTHLALNYRMDLTAFDDVDPGSFSARVQGQLGRQDLLIILGDALPAELAKAWPRQPLVAVGEVRGNLQKMHLKDLNMSIPSVFKGWADGFVANVTDTDHLKASLDARLTTEDLSFVSAMLPADTRASIRIPNGLGYKGHIDIDGQRYASNFTATEGGGQVQGKASIDLASMAYDADLRISQLDASHFVKGLAVKPLTGTVVAHGVGTDMLSTATRMEATIDIQRFGYDTYNLDNIKAKASIRNGKIIADLDSRNEHLLGSVTLNALTNGKQVDATVDGNLFNIDVYKLGFYDEPLVVSGYANMALSSNLNNNHQLKGELRDLVVNNNGKEYRPDLISIDILATADTTHANVASGDFCLDLDARGGYEQLLQAVENVDNELKAQIDHRYIDQQRIRSKFPLARIKLSSGPDNIVARLMNHYGYRIDQVRMDMAASPVEGLNGRMQIDSLVVDSMEVDTVRVRFFSDSTTINYQAQLRNGKDNAHYVFNALIDGHINERGTYIKTRLYDSDDALGLQIALQGSMHQNGVSVHIADDDPVLAYKQFSVNDSNYIYLGDDRRVRANMRLRAADGMGLQLLTDDENTAALQDLTVTLHQWNLGEVLAIIPYAPDIKGVMDGDFHIIQTTEDMTLSSSVNIDQLAYEGNQMGDVGTDFTYMPRSDGGHFVDGMLTHNGQEVGLLTGSYYATGAGVIDADLQLEQFPMELANGFIPDHLIGFRGKGEGMLAIKGSLDKPNVNGEVFLDSTYMFSEPYGVEMRFADDAVTIQDSRLLLENFEMYSNNDQPLTLSGYFDFSDMNNMLLDVRMRADNFLLVDSKETARSDAYGKAYVNFLGMMKGPLDNLQMRGKLDVLGTTDLKYILRDSPLSNDNQLEGLVEFVDFSDTTDIVVSRPPLTGLDMDLTVSIDQGAHVDCYLNADKSNYIDIVGGGDLRMQYNVVDDLRLTGRYTIESGEMKYSLPVIPLKTFEIQDGSYLQWSGDPMNPTLSLTATEEVSCAVSSGGDDSRVVKFDCGVSVSKTLQDMGLEFIIDAPDDMTISNQLSVMSTEERGKIAVTMLTTGMYLADGNTSGFTMNSALSAFLNSQINQISNKALRTLDVSIGMDSQVGGDGMSHTDYSFKFAKRFWNNRLKVSIGGKLSTGAETAQQNETFFDNVTLEYRLSATSNKYLNLFYTREDDDWLEGSVGKFGGGFMWKRKLQHLKDIFNFKKKDTDTPPERPQQPDSTRTETPSE